MISIKKENDVSLVKHLYVIHDGLYQIRVKNTQEVLCAVSSFSKLVVIGKRLIRKYSNLNTLRSKIRACEYNIIPSENELIRRKYEEGIALESGLYKSWYSEVTAGLVETERKTRPRKRLSVKVI